jgi:hypothetical protein
MASKAANVWFALMVFWPILEAFCWALIQVIRYGDQEKRMEYAAVK